MRYKKVDATGRTIRKGDVVRVVGVPDLSRMSHEGRELCEPVFAHIVGQYKQVDAFDRYGCAELNFLIRAGVHRGYHTVWIEPFLLRVREPRKQHLTNKVRSCERSDATI